MSALESNQKPRAVIGRYVLFGEIASGGMATVHYARLVGQVGFTRTVAIKRMLPHCAKDPDFASMFIDEARLVARIRHPNVVPVLDILAEGGELSLVMDYVQGESLWRLLRAARASGERPHVRIVAAIMAGVLEGLHAAHEAVSEQGEPLGIVHRDVSPQNIIVGVDGVPRVLDFGIAKASVRLQTTRDGELKGKLLYMSPEQIRRRAVDRRTDIYAASVVMWEALAGRPLFVADNEAAIICMVVENQIPDLRQLDPSIPPALGAAVMRGLRADPDQRFATAQQMAGALEDAVGVASPREVARWVETMASEAIRLRAAAVAEVESISSRFDSSILALPAAGLASDSARLTASRVNVGASGVDASSGVSARTGVEPVAEPTASLPVKAVRTRLVMAALVVAVVVGIAFAILIARPKAGSSADLPELRPSTTPAVVPSSAASTEAEDGGVSLERPDPAPSVRVEGPRPRTVPAAGAPRSAPGASQKPPAGAGCNPPYTIDKEGLRVPKPHCL
jgi:serine/threonine-protein kinase